jgi:ribonuclease P protein component
VTLGFPASRRLRKRREFLATQTGGFRISLPSCIVLVRARPDGDAARLGVTVTRKFGNAVVRNRAKRVVRESFRQSPQLFPRGIDIVVIPKASAAGRLGVHALRQEWQRAARLLAARAESLHRDLAKQAEAAQTGGPKGRAV